MKLLFAIFCLVAVLAGVCTSSPIQHQADFKVIAFYTAEQDLGHISFVREAQEWFPKIAAENNFVYESTNNWNNLNADYLRDYNVVLFLDTRPEEEHQRLAFQEYMENGGGFIGFHFSAFALTPSAYPQNWDWYHNTFLGSGQYVSNTWKPTPAFLKTETRDHGATVNLPDVFRSTANEWYRWENDLTQNPDIQILLSIDPSSFPLGTVPPEIWYDGYYPVAWTNRNFNMMYVNMGHNDIDYENGNADLSKTFEDEVLNRLFIDAINTFGFGNPRK